MTIPITTGNEGASLLDDSVPLIIGGVEVQSEDTYGVISPSTGKTVHKSSDANLAHAQDAVSAGAKVFESRS